MPEEVVNEENISTGPREEAEEEHEDDDEVPLYPGATISLKVVLLLLLAFVVRHKLSKEATDDLLYIINLICPQPNNCCTSVFKFRKSFSYLQIPTKLSYYCSSCIVPINYPLVKVCNFCNSMFTSAKLPSYFVHLSVPYQIKALFAKKTFLNDILHRFTRRKVSADHFEDVYDGELYKELGVPGALLSDSHNLGMWMALHSSSHPSLVYGHSILL